MIDRENVMSWLERLAQKDWREWYSDSDVQATALAVLILLREQEPVEPGKVQIGNRTDWYCRDCTTIVGRLFSEEDAWRFHHNFCPYCGKKVKWNET